MPSNTTNIHSQVLREVVARPTFEKHAGNDEDRERDRVVVERSLPIREAHRFDLFSHAQDLWYSLRQQAVPI